MKKNEGLIVNKSNISNLCPILFIYSFFHNTFLIQVLHLSQVIIFILIEDYVIFNYALKSVSASINIKQV